MLDLIECKGRVPFPPSLPAPPLPADAGPAGVTASNRAARKRGLASTILTGGLGATGVAPGTLKTLLGA